MIRVVVVFVIAAVVMLFSFNMAEFRVQENALPRYCTDQVDALRRVREIMTEKNPIGEDERRPYLVAAKLLYMIPRQDGETTEGYLLRLGDTIRGKCP